MADLLLASKNGYLTKVNELLEEGHSFKFRDRDNATALYWAACRGYGKICSALISAGSEIEARVKWGSTPLHAAADRGHAECVTVLIKSGAELNVQNLRRDSPLHLASYRGHTEIVEILICYRCNPFLLNEKNKTPAQEAKGHNFVRITKILQQYMEGKQLPGFLPYISENFPVQRKSLERSTSDNIRPDSLRQSDNDSHGSSFPSASSQSAYDKISNVEGTTESISDPESESNYHLQVTQELETFYDAAADVDQYKYINKKISNDDSNSERPVLRKSVVVRIKSEEPCSPLSWDEGSTNRTVLHSTKQSGRCSSSTGTVSCLDIQAKKVKRLSSPSTVTFDKGPLKYQTNRPLSASNIDMDGQAETLMLGSDTKDLDKKSIKQKYVRVEKFRDMCNYAENLQMRLLAANDRMEKLEAELLQHNSVASANKDILTEVQSCDDNLAYEISILKAKLNEESRLRNHYEIRCENLMDENRKLRGSGSSESVSRLLPRGGCDNLALKPEYNLRNLENIHSRSPDRTASNCGTSPYGIRRHLTCIITNSQPNTSLDRIHETNSKNSNVNVYDKSDLLGIKDTHYPESHDIKARPGLEYSDTHFVSPNLLALENPFTFASSLRLMKCDNVENVDNCSTDTLSKTPLLSHLDTGMVYDGFGEIMNDFSDFNQYRNAIF